MSVILFKQATWLWHPSHHGASHLGSSSHPIPLMKRLVSASRPSSRTKYPGASTMERGRTKQANEHEKPEKPERETGSKTGRGRNEHNKTTGRETERERTASKQGEGNEGMRRNHAQERCPSSFSPDPLSRVLVGLRASINPPPPGRGMSG